jgi:CO/xanthine dehydrogenase FAD-binding subunit
VRDAVVVVESSGGLRRLPWDAFLTGPKQTLRRADELIVGVEVPSAAPAREAFSKVGTRQAMVVAAVSCAAARFDDGSVRIALGAVGPTVIRARRAESFLETLSEIDSEALERLSLIVASEVRPITDQRATADYRRHAAGVIAARTVERVW